MCPQRFICIIKDVYGGAVTILCSGDGMSSEPLVVLGLHKGSVLNCCIFSFVNEANKDLSIYLDI